MHVAKNVSEYRVPVRVTKIPLLEYLHLLQSNFTKGKLSNEI